MLKEAKSSAKSGLPFVAFFDSESVEGCSHIDLRKPSGLRHCPQCLPTATWAAGAVTRKGLPFEQDGSHGNERKV